MINEIFDKPKYSLSYNNTKVCSLFEYDATSGGLVNKGNVNKRKTFDTLYFDQRELLVNLLTKFKGENMYPSKLSLDNKLGILLYGPPGTGKTGCISAIANFLERDILIINDFGSGKQVDKVFEVINKNKKRHIIVLDEFDYILSLQQEEETFSDKIREVLQNTQDIEERRVLLEQIKTSDKKDFFSKFLKFLDGVEDNDGRVIIATTNFPSKINKLFMRPGRFDLKLELGYCSEAMFYDIVHCVFPDCNNISNLGEILSKNVSPLVLINSLLQCKTPDELGTRILHELKGCHNVQFDI